MITTLRTLWHLMRADYLERVRRHGFLVTLGVTVWFVYVSLPPNHSRYVTMQLDETRGIYNSAWVGVVVAILTTVFLSLAGFYLVKNAVERDRMTGVGQILAATPLTKPLYTLGKAASNFAVLATIVLVVGFAAAGMQLVRGEDTHIDWVALLAPCVFVALPAMAVIGAVAVLFETIPALRGGLGNLAYFFGIIFAAWMPSTPAIEHGVATNDLLGQGILMPSVLAAHAKAFPELRGERRRMSIGFNFRPGDAWDLRTFRFEGVRWAAGQIARRMLWLLAAGAIAMAAAIPFDRFDTARSLTPHLRRRGVRAAGDEELDSAAADDIAPAVAGREAMHVHVADLVVPRRAPSVARLTLAELRLSMRGMPRAWYAMAGALIVAEAFAPLAFARAWILPAAWIWPILVWSQMGARDQRHQTSGLLFSSPHPLSRQLAAVWCAGALLAVALGLPVGTRLAFGGDLVGVAAWTAGAVFLPAMAMALGIWSGSGKAFEVLYTALWYLGPMNRVPFLDYVGQSSASVAQGAWRGFAVAAGALFALAVLGRRRQLRR